jgi:hypothetical protein
MGIHIYDVEYSDQQIEHGVLNIESALYQALIKLAGLSDIVRGKIK